eukprot:TRINITY_DN3791_c2_g2_i1.p1 TRINITY_DN3791_c2_g2~~TRINITY_DN3791_c2_g2_i1.p1  ORF type:complete len:256 (+),score=42.71 TRINITY_DN3791_c2_g2_i1:47-814(+)
MEQPPDTDIMAHEKEVRDEAASAALVASPLPVDVLKEQYAENPGFLRKAERLGERFQTLRRTRPDGNCFYRAYMFSIFEQIAGNKERYKAFSERAKTSLDFCMAAGYEKVAIEDFYDEFLASIDTLGADGANESTIQGILEENDGYLVCWSRVLTSAYLKRHKEDYEAFLTSHSSIQQFCAQEVDPMHRDADHLQITALSSFLGVPVCVVYLDNSEGDTAAEHKFEADGNGGALGAFETIHLLYRPGHYDVIYLK